MEDWTTSELEEIVFKRSVCYKDSEAFQRALAYVKKSDAKAYKRILYMEAEACGGLD
jgi:hypothetical protein